MTPLSRHLGASARYGLLALTLAVLASGCGSRSTVVARVGAEDITVGEFEDVARRAQGLYSAPPESAKALLLDDLVQRSLLVQAAQRPTGENDTLAAYHRKRIEREVLFTAMMERLAPRSVAVSEAELRTLYEWRSMEAHIQLIFSPTRDLAMAALREIQGGLDFGAAADRFNPSQLFPPRGDLGFVAPGQLVSPLDDLLRTAPLGQPVGPVHPAGEGWFLIRVLERRPREQAPFEQERTELASLLQQRKRRLLMVEARERLRDAYRIRVDEDAAELLFTRFNQPASPPGEDPEFSLPPETRDMSRVLARFDGGPGRSGVYTMGDAIAELEGGAADAPAGSMLNAYDRWIEARVLQRVIEIEARARRLHEEPAISEQIKERFERGLLEQIYDAEVVSRTTVEPQDLAVAFRETGSMFARLESATIEHISLPDSSTAVAVLSAAQRAGGIAQAILGTSSKIVHQVETVSFPTSNATWRELEPEIFRAEPGSFLGPHPAGNRWLVARLVSKRQSTPSLERLSGDERAALESAALQFARDRRLKEYCDELKRELPVTIHRDVLRRIGWSSAPPGLAG